MSTTSPAAAPENHVARTPAGSATDTARLTWDVVMLVFLALFSGWVMMSHFLGYHVLYHDNRLFYGLFRDQLHAANRFGEWALWFPHYQSGWPGYYYGLLGDLNFSSPVFVANQALFWLAGRLGFLCGDFLPPYVLYFGFEVPLLSLVATYAVARQLFRDPALVRYACATSAFSPGVLLNVSDIGFLEPVAYGLFFLASFIAWYRRQSTPRWLLLGLATCMLAVSVNYTFLIWNVIFVPTAVIAFLASQPRGFRRLAEIVVARFRHLALLAASAALCVAPNIIVLSQGRDMVRPHLAEHGGTRYPVDAVSVGNPIEALVASVPGLGMAWKDNVYQPVKPDAAAKPGYTYLGFACWPLIIVLLAGGTARVRMLASSLILFFYGVILLGSGSPAWRACLALVSPLRANQHYSDLMYRGGGYVVLVFAAAAGLGLLLRRDDGGGHRRRAGFCVAGMAAFSFAIYGALAGNQVLGYPALGIMLLLTLAYSVLLRWPTTDASRRQASVPATALLLVVSLFDVATNATLHLRSVVLGSAALNLGYPLAVRDEPLPTHVGFVSEKWEYANSLIFERRFLEVTNLGLDLQQLPAEMLFSRAHKEGSCKDEVPAFVAAVNDKRALSLAIDAESAGSDAFKGFLDVDASSVTDVKLARTSMTYNTVSYEISTPRNVILYLNDAFSPHWRAELDGRPTPIARALARGKAVAIPAGNHALALTFRPPLVLESLAGAYGLIITYALLWGLSHFEGAGLRKSP